MRRRPFGQKLPSPPTFEESRNDRQRVRAAGLDPNHWYIAAKASGFKPGEVRQIRFWGRNVALFRRADGTFAAIEDRCAHRGLALSAGCVDGDKLVCAYHGWGYDSSGCVAKIPHETFGHDTLNFRVEHFAVRERYGFVWVFFGDPEKAATTDLPALPELDGPRPWPHSVIEYRLHAHHSMVNDNVSDYTHEYLHRKLRPFQDPHLLGVDSEGDKVVVRYRTKIGAGKAMELFIRRTDLATGTITLTYDYPYNRSDADGFIKHFICPLPEDERTTRIFVIVMYKGFRVPFTRESWLPRRVAGAMVAAATPLVVKPVFDEDAVAVQLEQEAWEDHWDAPIAELNPQVKAFQDLTIRKWASYLASAGPVRATRGAARS